MAVESKQYKNFVFDLYGTLADIKTDEYSNTFWAKIAELLVCYGADYKPQELKVAYENILPKTGPSFTCTYPEFDVVKVFQKIVRLKSGSCSQEKAKSIAFAFRVISRKYLKTYSGVCKCLKMLKENQKKIYLLSNAQAAFTEPELKILGIRDYFDDIFLSSDAGVKKPDSLYYQMLIHKHQLKPEECLMIGNDLHADIEGGKKAGMDTLYFHSNLSDDVNTPVMANYYVMDGDFKKVANLLSLF